jgi:hypothetical protein
MLLALVAVAQSPALAAGAGGNLMADPFQVNARSELPPPPSSKQLAAPLPPVPPPAAVAPVAALPPGLRVVLIRNSGQGLLGTADAGATSIVVSSGKSVRLNGQDYWAEVSATQIRLYAAPKGKIVWEGMLGGPAMSIAPVDMSQARFVPPMSAGVNPGLRGAGAAK